MGLIPRSFLFYAKCKFSKNVFRHVHTIPFVNLCDQITGEKTNSEGVEKLKSSHPKLLCVTDKEICSILKVLEHFQIKPSDAIEHPHLFTINPETVHNYCKILDECGFIQIKVINILRYLTLTRSKTIEELKRKGLINRDTDVIRQLLSNFKHWPPTKQPTEDTYTPKATLRDARLKVTQHYLDWRLGMNQIEFQHYVATYSQCRHRPLRDMEEALRIAEEEIGFPREAIKHHPYIIFAQVNNTKLILEKVKELAALDVKEVLQSMPSIINRPYSDLLEMKNIFRKYEISEKAQRKCLRIFCIKPETVERRIQKLKDLPEYTSFAHMSRALLMILHMNKVEERLQILRTANRNEQCKLEHLLTSEKKFEKYLQTIGIEAVRKEDVQAANS